MIKINIILLPALIICCVVTPSTFAQTVNPVGIKGKWLLIDNFSDEFNTASTDFSKWDNNVPDWGTWSWEPENAYQQGGNLHIRMAYKPHMRGNQELFLTSGIYKSKTAITYGYFESRIKAASILPGTCPAFWMKGDGPNNQNCEVDFLEYRESDPLKYLATNLHAKIDTSKNGIPVWIRENRNYVMPWDPRNDYHIYGCETRPDSIIWYVDGKRINAAKNKYWHFPQYVMLSMGVRLPYRTFKKPLPEYPEGSESYPDPVTTMRDKNLFPTEMFVDYVRVWKSEVTSNVIEGKLNRTILVLPNPASDFLTINNPEGWTASTITIFDLNGKVLKQISNVSGIEYKLSLQGLAKGVYCIKIEENNQRFFGKFIKK